MSLARRAPAEMQEVRVDVYLYNSCMTPNPSVRPYGRIEQHFQLQAETLLHLLLDCPIVGLVMPGPVPGYGVRKLTKINFEHRIRVKTLQRQHRGYSCGFSSSKVFQVRAAARH